MATTYLTRTPSTNGNRQIFTFSAWIKRSALSSSNTYAIAYFGATSITDGTTVIRFLNDELNVYIRDGSNNRMLTTNRLFRDTSAWYHIVVEVDTTQATESNRVKLYVNGEQETSFSSATYPTQNLNLNVSTSGQINRLGVYADSGGSLGSYFDGSMSHFHFIDGTAYDATAFGQYDANGVWTINTSPSVTYGTNGFFILKNGNSVTDQSGNGNNFTVASGTLTKTEDSPSNVFATMNRLDNFYANATVSNGNTTVATDGTNETFITSTLAVSTGKYYWEVEFDAGSDNSFIGIIDRVSDSSSFQSYIDATNGISYKKNGAIYTNGGNMSGVNIGTYTTGDIISVAMDLDNNKLYFGKNGSWLNSGVPTSGSTGTGAFSINSSPKDGVYYAQVGDDNTGSQTLKCNFGNGYFGTTAVSSAGTNASGIGIFEYDVPNGYTALSTKGLNL